MSYRDPAYLAKVAATVDMISEGRLEMGIGAGWYEAEWRAYGYGFPSAGERLGRLREGVEIFRQAWTTGSATLAGEHYQVAGARRWPRPLQGTSAPGSATNGIPLWIAGGRRAQDAADRGGVCRLHQLRRHPGGVRAPSRDPARSLAATSAGTSRASPAAPTTTWSSASPRRRSPSGSPGMASTIASAGLCRPGRGAVAGHQERPAVGTPEQIVERLSALKALGMAYAITYFAEAAYDLSGVELFEPEVIPRCWTLEPREHHRRWHLPGLH
jgi:alkanesulfonate monooxygenase SsuD/methylene tetrahydromethanopterin reductase-like flavin-dependent oxidoreductase (luciferase family)